MMALRSARRRLFSGIVSCSLAACALSAGMVSTGCGPTIVPSQGPRPATNPSAVGLYQDPPARYEELGIIKTDRTFEWDRVGQMQSVVDELKAKAAALGANGVLLQVPDYRLKATGTYDEEHYQVPIERSEVRAAMATAIYVHKK